jgi:two-component system chemotaxis response regulator CheB
MMPEIDRVVVIVASRGGVEALSVILGALPSTFEPPIVLVIHRGGETRSVLSKVLARRTALTVTDAIDGQVLAAGTVYVALPGRHVIVRKDGCLELSDGPTVHRMRPAGDPLFASAAARFGDAVIAIVLTGGDGDGADGLCAVRAAGGVTIAQSVEGARDPSMPRHAIATGAVDFVLPLDEIGPMLVTLAAEPIVRGAA